MPEVAICSLVRDGMDYLPSFRGQLDSLRLTPGTSWRLHILEGDSQDGTWAFLQKWASEDPRISLAQEQAGEAVEKEDRAARWARVGNSCLDLVPTSGPHTHVLWLEADLCFPPELLSRLLAHQVDIVAPMIYLGGQFYDTWGFRDIEGQKWTNLAPYHPEFKAMSLMEMGSVGSCVLFRREVLEKGIRFKGTYENGLLVGMCQDARAVGFRVWADTGTAILHPVDQWEAQMWRPSSVQITPPNGISNDMPLGAARALGMESNLPILDPETLLRSHRRFWNALLLEHHTNRLDIEVRAKAYPQKSYALSVKYSPPSGIMRIPLIRKLLIGAVRPASSSRRKNRLGSLLSKVIQLHLTIVMEESI